LLVSCKSAESNTDAVANSPFIDSLQSYHFFGIRPTHALHNLCLKDSMRTEINKDKKKMLFNAVI